MTDTSDRVASLLRSAINGDLLEACEVLAVDPSFVNCRGHGRLTPLMLAAAGRHLALVRLLVGRGADLHLIDECGEDALLKACMTRRNAAVVEVLLDYGSSVNRANLLGRTPLVEASSLGDEESVTALLKRHPDVNHVTKDDETALTFAIVNGTTAVVRSLISARANVNWVDKGGSTPLILAISEEEVDKVRALLDANADPAHRGFYALRQAVRTGNVEMIGTVAARCDVGAVRRMAEEVNALGQFEISDALLRTAGNRQQDKVTENGAT